MLTLLHKTKALLGDILYAFEVMDRESMELVLEMDQVNAVNPFQGRSSLFPFYVLIETGSREAPLFTSQQSASEDAEAKPKNDADLDKLFQLFEHAGDEIIDGVVAQDMKQFKQLWYLREQVAPAGVKLGYVSELSKEVVTLRLFVNEHHFLLV